jgi:hypothetical protein
MLYGCFMSICRFTLAEAQAGIELDTTAAEATPTAATVAADMTATEAAESAAETASQLSSLDALSSMGLDDDAAGSSLMLPAGKLCP